MLGEMQEQLMNAIKRYDAILTEQDAYARRQAEIRRQPQPQPAYAFGYHQPAEAQAYPLPQGYPAQAYPYYPQQPVQGHGESACVRQIGEKEAEAARRKAQCIRPLLRTHRDTQGTRRKARLTHSPTDRKRNHHRHTQRTRRVLRRRSDRHRWNTYGIPGSNSTHRSRTHRVPLRRWDRHRARNSR